MARLERVRCIDAIKNPFSEVFQNTSEEESTLLQALLHKKVTLSKQQTYININGEAISAINKTVPIIYNETIIAAIEIFQGCERNQEHTKFHNN